MAFWQAAHSRHHQPTSAAMPLHTTLEDRSRLEALMPGWARECTARNTFFCQGRGTCGRRWLDEVSHLRSCWPTGVDWTAYDELLRSWATLGQLLLPAVPDQCFQRLLPLPLSHVEGPQRCHLPPGRRPATQRAPLRRPSWLAQEQGLPVGAWRGDQPQC